MSPGGERARTARVHFDEGFFTQDVERASAAGKAAAAAARAKYHLAHYRLHGSPT